MAQYELDVMVRSWLEAHAEELELEAFPSYVTGDWHVAAYHVATAASEPGGPLEHVGFWLVCDPDGMIEGAIVTVDVPGGTRLASLHQDFRDLTDDREAPGIEGAAAVIRAIRRIADVLLAEHLKNQER